MSLDELTIYPRLKDKVVLITGASAGIGKDSAYHFAACGSKLILTARREDRLKEIQEDLEKKFNSKVFIYPLDIANFEQCEAFFGSIPEEFKNVDILVNNAGLALERNTTWESEWDHIETMINVNVKGVLKMIKLFVPGMIERKVGHIITVGSIAGKQSYPGGSIYCGTKHMIEGVNTALRFELVGTPLRVSLVCPGLVETEFSMTRFQGDETKAKSVYEGCQPLTGADIADNIVYIASRPPHVQIVDIITFPTCQAAVTTVHKE